MTSIDICVLNSSFVIVLILLYLSKFAIILHSTMLHFAKHELSATLFTGTVGLAKDTTVLHSLNNFVGKKK